MIQSYVDLCINGCIELEEKFPQAKEIKFTKKFIRNTKYWSKHWVNDRILPRRPTLYCKNADRIDGYLKEFLRKKELFSSIKIE